MDKYGGSMICLRTRVLLCELPCSWSWSQGSLLLWMDVSAVCSFFALVLWAYAVLGAVCCWSLGP